jgi:hypothetical protein
MRNSVPNRHRQFRPNLLAQKAYQFFERCRYGGNFRRGPPLIDQCLSRRVLGNESRLCPDAFYLTFEAPFQLLIISNCEQLKLDARTTSVHH